MVFEELLQNDIQEIRDSDKLSSFVDDILNRSTTANHWINKIIKFIFTCLFFVIPKREEKCLLYLKSVKEMLPFFKWLFIITMKDMGHIVLEIWNS